MKERWIGGVCLLLLLAGGGGEAGAREVEWRGSGGWGAGMPYAQLFVGAAPLRTSGTVVRLERCVPLPGMADGYALLLRTREGTLTVHLGPAWYLERQDFPLDADDAVDVLGVRTSVNGQPVVLATEVRKKGKVLLLRSDSGLPLWSAWRSQ